MQATSSKMQKYDIYWHTHKFWVVVQIGTLLFTP